MPWPVDEHDGRSPQACQPSFDINGFEAKLDDRARSSTMTCYVYVEMADRFQQIVLLLSAGMCGGRFFPGAGSNAMGNWSRGFRTFGSSGMMDLHGPPSGLITLMAIAVTVTVSVWMIHMSPERFFSVCAGGG